MWNSVGQIRNHSMPRFQITQDHINSLVIRGADENLLNRYRYWIQHVPELNELIPVIRTAFQGITLGDGIGLLEANGLDDYASDKELAELRAKDERTDWQNIEIAQLNYCYVAPTYMDARGYYFHLPAFLIADLQDQFNVGFVDESLVNSFAAAMRLSRPAHRSSAIRHRKNSPTRRRTSRIHTPARAN